MYIIDTSCHQQYNIIFIINNKWQSTSSLMTCIFWPFRDNWKPDVDTKPNDTSLFVYEIWVYGAIVSDVNELWFINVPVVKYQNICGCVCICMHLFTCACMQYSACSQLVYLLSATPFTYDEDIFIIILWSLVETFIINSDILYR